MYEAVKGFEARNVWGALKSKTRITFAGSKLGAVKGKWKTKLQDSSVAIRG